MKRYIGLAFSALVFASNNVLAVPHVNPKQYPNAKPCHIRRFTTEDIKKYGSPRAAAILNATGTKNIAVIIVDFPGADANTSLSRTISNPANFDTYFNGAAGMNAYYNEVSFGNLTLNFKYFGNTTGANILGSNTAVAAGSFQVDNAMEYYGCGDVDDGCSGVVSAPSQAGGAYLIRDALLKSRAATGGPNAADFDAVLVMHAGYGNETSGKNGDIWSAYYPASDYAAIINAGGGGFDDGATFPELETAGITSPLGVMCHEFGHVLTLPDLYNTSVVGGASAVGKWELMDAGPYLGNGANPAHLGAWSKKYLNWISPQTVSSRGSYTLTTVSGGGSGNTNQVLQLPVHNGGALEYFLVEYRSRTAGIFDRYIPGTGFLVWHIDDEITNARGFSATNPALSNQVNTGNPHYGVGIIPANGLSISASNQGTAGNVFSDGQVFTNPKSDNFEGEPSGVTIVNITGVGGASANLQVANLAVTGSQTISKAINYPNPAGKGYTHPSGENHTTIQFQLTRPANDYEINVYTLSGDLVRKINKEAITVNIDRSQDLKWVYEFNWDLKNGDGELVAPGVYLYLVRADGHSKSQKAVVIR